MCSIPFYINVGYLKLDDIDQPISLRNNEVIKEGSSSCSAREKNSKLCNSLSVSYLINERHFEMKIAIQDIFISISELEINADFLSLISF